MLKIGILGSTRGSAMVELIELIKKNAVPLHIAMVLSDKPTATILTNAALHGLQAKWIDPAGLSREQYDAKLNGALKNAGVDYVLLIGFMRILSSVFTHAWRGKAANVHPSLLPDYAGLMDLAVHTQVIQDKKSETGCTVHEVTEKLDAGPILLQKKCAVLRDDTPHTLKARVQALESVALLDILIQKSALLCK